MVLVEQLWQRWISIRQFRKVKLCRCFCAVVGIVDGDRIFEIPGNILTLERDIFHVIIVDLLNECAVRNLYNI